MCGSGFMEEKDQGHRYVWMGVSEEGQSPGKVCLLQSLVELRELVCVWAEVGRAEPLTSGLRKCHFLSFLKEKNHTHTHTHTHTHMHTHTKKEKIPTVYGPVYSQTGSGRPFGGVRLCRPARLTSVGAQGFKCLVCTRPSGPSGLNS